MIGPPIDPFTSYTWKIGVGCVAPRACSSDVLLNYMDATADLGSRLMAAYGRLRTAPCCSAGPASAAPSRR